MSADLSVHILQYGFALCGFSVSAPGDWPEGHRWVRLEDRDKADCAMCLKVAQHVIEAQQRGAANDP